MYFAEGITIVGDSIWQLTWLENTALLRDINSLDTIKEASCDNQGWGICYTGDVLVPGKNWPEIFKVELK